MSDSPDDSLDTTTTDGLVTTTTTYQAAGDGVTAITTVTPTSGGEVAVPNEIPAPDYMPSFAVFRPPSVPGDGTTGTGGTSVNTDALQTFSQNLAQLEPHIREAMTGLEAVAIRPGAFYQAFHLSSSVNGESGLARTTFATLSRALDAIAEIRASCTRLRNEYETTSELSTADATRFAQLVGQSTSVINTILSDQA